MDGNRLSEIVELTNTEVHSHDRNIYPIHVHLPVLAQAAGQSTLRKLKLRKRGREPMSFILEPPGTIKGLLAEILRGFIAVGVLYGIVRLVIWLY